MRSSIPKWATGRPRVMCNKIVEGRAFRKVCEFARKQQRWHVGVTDALCPTRRITTITYKVCWQKRISPSAHIPRSPPPTLFWVLNLPAEKGLWYYILTERFGLNVFGTNGRLAGSSRAEVTKQILPYNCPGSS